MGRVKHSQNKIKVDVNDVHKLSNGDQTYTFLMQQVVILGHQLSIIIFVDISQQEKLFKATLE